ncbi:MAG: chemotaxis protein CheW [Thermostichales cyanobacterium SZTDM-1c_bins_54]
MVGDLGFLMTEETPDIQDIEAPEGEPYLKFLLSNGAEIALPALSVVEVMSVAADRITPMPNVSPTLLGTLNLRGEIIWVADLGQFMGEGLPLNVDRVEIPVIAVKDDDDLIMGLAVDAIVGMEWLKTDQLKSSPGNPLIRGEWHNNGKSLRLLDHTAILRSPRWSG